MIRVFCFFFINALLVEPITYSFRVSCRIYSIQRIQPFCVNTREGKKKDDSTTSPRFTRNTLTASASTTVSQRTPVCTKSPGFQWMIEAANAIALSVTLPSTSASPSNQPPPSTAEVPINSPDPRRSAEDLVPNPPHPPYIYLLRAFL